MKKLLSLVVAMIIAATTFAQVNEVTLTTIGTGVNEEQATLQALRSAIEQSFGTFVSANTTILNDRLVQDEIVSVSNGNVKEYQKLAVATLPNGQISVSAKVTVSINKLVAYAKSKGSRAEFAGQAFSANLKIMQLRAKSTQETIDLMIQQLEKIGKDMFDFKMLLGEPQNLGGKYYFFPTIEVYSNEASTNFYNIVTKTLGTLKLSETDKEFCRNNGIGCAGGFYPMDDGENEGESKIYLPITQENWDKLKRNLAAIVNNAYCRYVIFEIGNPQNTFACGFKHKFYKAEDGTYHDKTDTKLRQTRRLTQYPIQPNEMVLVSKRTNKWVDYIYYENYDKYYFGRKNGYGTMCSNPYKLSKSFCLTEVRTPIKLNKQQQKDVKNGTYNGPTYTTRYVDPQLLLKIRTGLTVDAQRMTSGAFQGFELK